MALGADRACPRCNMLVAADQRFCSNCGAVVEASANHPTEQTPNSSMADRGTYLETPPSGIADRGTYLETQTPPPPPPDSYSQTPFLPPSQVYLPPSYAVPPKDTSKKVVGQIGCGVLAIILLALGLCGTAGFFIYRAVSSTTNSVSETISTGNVGSSNATPTLVPPTTSAVNATIKYADVDITIKDVKEATGFADDTSSYANAPVVRIDLNENNKTAHASSYYYGDMVRLLLADGTSLTPRSTQYSSGPDAAVSRANWVDFAVTSTVDVKQLTLQFGKADEAQMAIPLTNNPDVAKYQPKTVTPNKATQYVGTDWTLVSATAQLSGDNKQAPKGQMYVIVTVKIDNNSARGFQGYTGDYVRLQTGDTKAAPSSNTTIPLSVDAGQTNQTGTSAFLVPQGSTNFTLLLLASTSTGATQPSSLAFQIQ